ncbi:MAG: RagB/SusD family nutrient uptake outer membrane protein [Prevotella sp.]|nr:RagB/SusD family nutrient uptake outer membrane protein [Prevotella sp.]MDY4556491.1 RagB/SusD family nutrient uptake outer membrane protein [Prevotella sp.]MDY4629332.1 RagB/SusD family nutrient uptake outer membrane protein [Prevotella sp.]
MTYKTFFIKTVMAVGITIAATSCEGFLDITPDGQVKRDEMLATNEGVEDALYGVYAKLRNTTLYGQEMYFSSLEIMSQTLYCYGNTGVTALGQYDYNNTTVKNVFAMIWNDMYNNISNVNSVLNAPLVDGANAYPANIYKGEALALRAMMHFDLMRLFAEQITVNPNAKGIPYATEFSLKTPDFETLAENYNHVLADLQEAERLLADEGEYENTTSFMADRQIHLNLHAVRALMARVFLTKGDKEKALEYAEKVIVQSGRQLKTKTEVINDVAGVLSKKECLFGVYFSGFYTQVSAKLQQTISYSSLDLRGDFMEMYENGVSGLDFRTTAYFTSVDMGGTAKYRLSKFTDIYDLQNNASARPADLIQGINMIRLPEMYYIAAECLLDKDYPKALDYFNEVVTNRGLDALSGEGEETLTQEVINTERYKEMIGEGQTFFNMKRLNLSIPSYDNSVTYRPEDGIYVVPIPDSEYENRN